ncbi:hypothetical protein, partial [Vibrio vulnificus]|uniref:hypothetical protein n=1 Tax=Vibrio vulnificus TaxID=672 RepID=UPI0039B5C128
MRLGFRRPVGLRRISDCRERVRCAPNTLPIQHPTPDACLHCPSSIQLLMPAYIAHPASNSDACLHCPSSIQLCLH